MRKSDGINIIGKVKRISLKGVYQIGNDINDYVYIGSSRDLFRRMSGHLSNLKVNKSTNKPLQEFYNKYGIEHIVIKVLEYCKEDVLKQREQYYMDRTEHLFNVTPKADENYKFTLDDMKNGCRKVMQFDLEGNYLMTYDSLTEASEKTGTRISSISGVASLKKRYKTSNGYIWRYESKR